jgi:hypothetical protein
MSFKLILKEVTYAHTVAATKHFVETSFLMEIELLFGGNHLRVECSTAFLLPYWGATPFSSPPSIDGYTCPGMDFMVTFFRMVAFLSFRWNCFWEVITDQSLIEEAEPNELSSTFLTAFADRA